MTDHTDPTLDAGALAECLTAHIADASGPLNEIANTCRDLALAPDLDPAEKPVWTALDRFVLRLADLFATIASIGPLTDTTENAAIAGHLAEAVRLLTLADCGLTLQDLDNPNPAA